VIDVRSEVLIAMFMKITVLRDVRPCSLVDRYNFTSRSGIITRLHDVMYKMTIIFVTEEFSCLE
jgi:hypothetical protein